MLLIYPLRMLYFYRLWETARRTEAVARAPCPWRVGVARGGRARAGRAAAFSVGVCIRGVSLHVKTPLPTPWRSARRRARASS